MSLVAFLPGYEYSDDIYEVEKIVDCEMRNGVYVYRVRWKGCPREQDTWEPEENLLTCDDLLKTFKEERENKRKKRKQKRKERRNEFIRNSAPLHIKVKEEEDEDGSDSDEVTPEKKKSPSALVSPSSDMDEIDLSGLTRKQRLAVQKVIEQSRKDAELASPTSSTTDENDQYKRVTFTKKAKGEASSSTEVISRKKKKIGKVPVIDESSDSDGSVIEPRGTEFSKQPVDVDKPSTSGYSSKESVDRETMESKDSEEPISPICDSNICSEDVAKNKGKKPSEILGNIFGTPNKTLNSPINRLPSSPINRLPSSPICNLNSPVNILCISDDSNDEHLHDKQTKRNLIDTEQDYVPLLDQLQMRMDPSPLSFLQTSIDFDEPNEISIPKTPDDPYKINHIPDRSDNTVSSSYPDRTHEINMNEHVSKESAVVASAEKTQNANTSNLMTNIPSSSTLKFDSGNGKRTYMKGVENIRNTLAMKRMLMNPEGSNNDKKRKENSPEITSNRYMETVLSETVIDHGEMNKELKTIQPSRPTETLKRSLSDNGNSQRMHQVMSSINISSSKNDTDTRLDVDFQKSSGSEKDYSHTPVPAHNSKEAIVSNKARTHNIHNTHNINENIPRNSEPTSVKDNMSKHSNIKQNNNNNKVIDPRTCAKPLGNNVSKTAPPPQKRIPFHKSLSSPAVPTAMKISRSEKLLNAMKSANTTKRPEKAKKLSLKEYNAKKASKQNLPLPIAPVIEFTKIPSVPPPPVPSNAQKVVNTSSVDKVAIIPPPPPSKPVERRISLEKREKGPKPSQIATNTDVIGNIMECFKQPLGRDSSSKAPLGQGSPVHPQEAKAATAAATGAADFDMDLEDLDEYSGDEDGMLRKSSENSERPTHLNLPHANTKMMDLLTIYQVILRGDIDTLIRCDINEKINMYVDEQDTLIMKAVMSRSQIAAQILLEKNADPNKTSKHGPRAGKTPLMVAVEMNHKSMVWLLVQNHARMNTQTQNGETALIMAAKLGHMEIIHVLLNSGADAKPAATYLEKKITDVPMNLLPELQRTLQHHSEKLKDITEKFLKDLLNTRHTQLGQSLMPLRCVSPEEMDEHEFYFKCNVNGVEPRTHVLMLALPVIFKRNGSIDVKFTLIDNGVKNVYLNDGQMLPTSPESSFVYFLFPKFGEINILRIESSDTFKHKILLCIYAMTYMERVDKNPGHVNRNLLPVPVH